MKFAALIKRSFFDVALSLLQRPKRLQTAALCYRKENGSHLVLLITSRGSGRWIIPKGWLMRGMTASQAATVEAWEEAGVRAGETSEQPLGSYVYEKVTASGLPISVETLVFAIEVQTLEDDFPESEERRRLWVDPSEAADMVAEPGLRSIIADFQANDAG